MKAYQSRSLFAAAALLCGLSLCPPAHASGGDRAPNESMDNTTLGDKDYYSSSGYQGVQRAEENSPFGYDRGSMVSSNAQWRQQHDNMNYQNTNGTYWQQQQQPRPYRTNYYDSNANGNGAY